MKKKFYLLSLVVSLFMIPPLFAAGTGIGETYTTYKQRAAAPATPGATYDRLYFYTGDLLKYITSAGTSKTVLVDGSAVSPLSVTINGLTYWSSATAESDEGSVTLPTITANYSGHGFVRVSASGVIADSAEFESGSDGNVSLIRATANVVVGAACADTKICISTAGAQNPIVVKSRNGAAQVEIEFWYK